MNLSETVAYPGLKHMCLCKSNTMQSACAQWLVQKCYSWSEYGVLAATTLMGGRAEVGGARTRSRCIPAFLLCSMSITNLLEVGWNPKGWSRSPEWIGVFPCVMAVFALVWDMAGAWGLRLHFCAGFTFFSVWASWLEAASGPEGLVPHHWADPTPSQVCTEMCTPVMAVSTLELATLPLECVQGHVSCQWLLTPWSALAGSFPSKCVHCHWQCQLLP